MPKRGESMSDEQKEKIRAAQKFTAYPQSKVCAGCELDLPAERFRPRGPAYPFILQSRCIECAREYDREKSRRHYHRHPEKMARRDDPDRLSAAIAYLADSLQRGQTA